MTHETRAAPLAPHRCQGPGVPAQRPQVQANLRDGLPYPYTEEDGADFIAAMLAADPDKVFPFAITQDGVLVGSIGLFRQENIHCRTAEMGYYLGRAFWGQGIGHLGGTGGRPPGVRDH